MNIPERFGQTAAAARLPSTEPTIVVLEGNGRRTALSVAELWRYRELFWVLVSRDVRVRYKQTVLGALWAIIQPVMLMIVFSIFFGRLGGIPSDGRPYPVFVYAALLPWTFFANAVANSSQSLVGSAHLVSKVYFPRLIIPFSSIGAALVDFCVASLVLLALMAWYSIPVGATLALLPLMVLNLTFVALGVGTALAALTVAYRDFRYVVPFMLQFWMFATPVVYPVSLVPGEWRWLLFVNPMAGVIEGFRVAFLQAPADPLLLSISTLSALVLFVAGVMYFSRVERRLADII